MITRFLFLTALAIASSSASADAFDITYGGRLTEFPSGNPVEGPVDLELRFFAGQTSATELTPAKTVQDVSLTQGGFALKLPLTAGEREIVFDSPEVWIGITDTTNGKTYPRQRFSGVPYALKVPVDPATLGYDGNGNLFVKNSTAGSFTQGDSQYVATDEIRARDADGLKLATTTAASVIVSTNGMERLRVDASGNVGIGTSSPMGGAGFRQGLEIVGQANTFTPTLLLRSSDATSNNAQILFAGPSGLNWIAGTDMSAGNGSRDFSFMNPVSGITTMTLQHGTGNVGIGTTSPQAKLDIGSVFRFDPTAKNITVGTPPFDNVTLIGADTASGIATTVTVQAGTYVGAAPVPGATLALNGGDAASSPLVGGNVSIKPGLGGGGYGQIHLAPTGGNVGIGTTAPIEALEVANGSIAATNSVKNIGIKLLADSQGSDANSIQFGRPNVYDGKADLRFTSWFGASTYMTIRGEDGTGHVSMGAGGFRALPENQLEVYASSVPLGPKVADFSGIKVMNTATSITPALVKSGVRITSDGSWSGAGAANVGLLVSSVTGGTNNYDAIFNGGGNVGIGTTAPERRLHLKGDASYQPELQFTGSSATPKSWHVGVPNADNASLSFTETGLATRMVISSGGNVGIGTTAPQATLDVQGYARLQKFVTAPVACDAAHDGSVALTSVNYLCVCISGTGWRRASDGSTACSTW